MASTARRIEVMAWHGRAHASVRELAEDSSAGSGEGAVPAEVGAAGDAAGAACFTSGTPPAPAVPSDGYKTLQLQALQ